MKITAGFSILFVWILLVLLAYQINLMPDKPCPKYLDFYSVDIYGKQNSVYSIPIEIDRGSTIMFNKDPIRIVGIIFPSKREGWYYTDGIGKWSDTRP